MVNIMDNSMICGNIDECFSAIINQIDSGNLAIFCGAGISFNSGIMTVEPMTKYLFNFLRADQEDIDSYLKDDNGYFKLPIPFEAIIESLKRSIQIENSKKDFIESFAQLFNGTPNINHKLFAHLLLSKKISFIATTNFDTCLEQALGWKEGNDRIIIPYAMSLEQLENVDINGKVIKLHGCKSRPECLGTTVEQITKKEYYQKTLAILDKIFYENNDSTVLFIGYSCSDLWDITEYFNTCKLLNKNLTQCIYWQHSNQKSIMLDSNPWDMLSKHSTLFFGGNTYDLIIKLCTAVDVETEEIQIHNSYKTLENCVPVNSDFVLGRLFEISHYHDLAIKYYNKILNSSTASDVSTRIQALARMSSIYSEKNNLEYAEKAIVEALNITNQLGRNEYYTYLVSLTSQYADLLYDFKKFKSAKDLYENNIHFLENLFKGTSDKSFLGNLYNSLSLVLKELKDYENAEKYFERALHIFRNCADKYPQEYLPDVAMVLCNWAIMLDELNNVKNAEILYNEALKIRRKLANVNATYLPDVATTLNNLGVCISHRKDYFISIKLLEEALEIRRNLATLNADIYLPYIATTLENLANCYNYLYNYEMASKLCLEAIEIYRDFSDESTGEYLVELANSLTDMSNILCNAGKYDEALSYCEEAVVLRKILVDLSEDVFLSDLIKSYIALATIQQYNRINIEAAKTYKTMLQLSKKNLKRNRNAFIKQYAMILYNYANFNYGINNFEQSIKLYNEALSIFEELSQKHPEAFLPNVRDVLKQLCFINKKQGKSYKNIVLLERILEIDQDLTKSEPQKHLANTAMDLIDVAEIHYENGDIMNAKTIYERALRIIKSFESDELSKYAQKLVNALNFFGIINFELSEFDIATKSYKDALNYNERYCKKDNEDYYYNIAMTYHNMVNSQLQNSNCDEEIIVCIKNCIEAWRKLMDIDECEYCSDLASELDKFGCIYFQKGYNDEAEECLAEMLSIYENLAAKNPEQYLLELAIYQTAVAKFYLYNIVNKAKSKKFALKAITNLRRYTPCKQIKAAIDDAQSILQYWSND